MDDGKRIETLEEAQGLLNDAIYLIRQAVKGSSEEIYADRYMIRPLDQFAEGNSKIDISVQSLINTFSSKVLVDA